MGTYQRLQRLQPRARTRSCRPAPATPTAAQGLLETALEGI